MIVPRVFCAGRSFPNEKEASKKMRVKNKIKNKKGREKEIKKGSLGE